MQDLKTMFVAPILIVAPILFWVLILFWAPPAVAQEIKTLVAVDASVTCISQPELQALLSQKRFAVIQVSITGEPGDNNTGQQLSVQISGPSHEIVRLLDLAPCAAQTAMVAAYINTTLAVLETPPINPPPARPNQVSATPVTPLSPTPIVAPTPLPVHSESNARSLEQSTIEQRATLLAVSLPAKDRSIALAAASELLLGAGSVALGIALREDDDSSNQLGTGYLVGGGVLITGGVAGLLVEEDYQETVIASTYLIGLALPLLANNDEDVSSLRVGSFAVLANAALLVGESIYRRPISRRKLRKHAKALSSPQARRALTRAQLDEIERDYARSARVLPTWIHAAPGFITGGYILAQAIDNDEYELDALIVAGVLISAGATMMKRDITHGYRGYLHKLGIAELDWSVAPNGVAMNGTF